MSFRLHEFICILVITGEAISAESSDKEVLIELKHFLQANNEIHRGDYDSWSESDATPCSWSGVVCDGTSHVISLDLSRSSIFGPAFGNFSGLSTLARLDLSDNAIFGALPMDDLSQCRSLVYLNLSYNLITGQLDLSGLTRLHTLDVSRNRFLGAIFPAMRGNLTVLDVSTNNLTGSISGLLDNCPKLEYVDLSSNSFTGQLWQGVARLRQFSVAMNNLTGRIPSTMFPSSCKLESLGLSGNHLHGNFPNSIANCGNLTYLSLWGNGFRGSIPSGIARITGLKTLILGSNRFDRRVPPGLTNCTKLQVLDISTNLFGGEVQKIFGKLSSLKHLILYHNMYTDGIYSSGVLQLPQLAKLDLSFNRFSGKLPDMTGVKALQYLILAYNNFSGGIPPVYGHLSELQALDLSYNQLSGTIPESIGNLTSLLWLMLAGNRLSGKIPPEIGNCTSLLYLNLAGNRLSGTIPPEMTGMGKDPEPTFAKNRNDPGMFAGSGECLAMKRWIPAGYPPFSFLYSVMTRQYCRNIWDRILKGFGIVPIYANSSSFVRQSRFTGYVVLSGNMLSGEIPPEIGAMQYISLLLLDDNKLNGRLPSEVANLPLFVLNASRNSISAVIPSEISHVACLEWLDLSCNNFSGELPLSLSQLTQLSRFNVSYNPLLGGSVPTSGQFGTFDELSFLGDPLISLSHGNRNNGSASREGPPPLEQGMTSRTIPPWILFSIVIAVVTAAATFFTIILLSLRFPELDFVSKFKYCCH